MKKLAFCFLIYDKINHEELWNTFFEYVDKNKYQIYIHYKYNEPLKYFEKYKLNNCIPTQYAHVSLIHATNILLKKAFEDGCCKFINVSNSCIPLKSFDYIYDFLTKDDSAYFNISPSNQIFPRCNHLLKYYNQDVICKSHQWMILNRHICELILQYTKTQIDYEYGSITAPEEHFYITIVCKYKLADQVIASPNLADGATTFTNWADMNYKYKSEKDLKNYSHISEEELKYLMNSKSLFGRKFNVDCKSLYDNEEYVQFITSNSSA